MSRTDDFNARFGRLRKQPQSQTPAPQTEEDTLLGQFNEYCKKIADTYPNVRFNKKKLLALFKDHGENAVEVYLNGSQKTQSTPARPKTLSITEAQSEAPQTQPQTQKQPEETPQPPQSEDKKKTWVNGFEKSLNKWTQKNTFKNTDKPKRQITTTKTETSLNAEILPATPSPKRPDQGVEYHFESAEEDEKINVTVTNKNPQKPLNYDYVYALVKTAKENGIETIEFTDIKTKEFANMLMVASLQFGLKMSNQPEHQIDENAPYIPKSLKETIQSYNEGKEPFPQETSQPEHKKSNTPPLARPSVERE